METSQEGSFVNTWVWYMSGMERCGVVLYGGVEKQRKNTGGKKTNTGGKYNDGANMID